MSDVDDELPKGLFNVNWEKRAANIISYLKINPRPKRKPRLVRMFGYKNFRLKENKLFVFGREVLLDSAKIREILEREETGYGGWPRRTRASHKSISVSLHATWANFLQRASVGNSRCPNRAAGPTVPLFTRPVPG